MFTFDDDPDLAQLLISFSLQREFAYDLGSAHVIYDLTASFSDSERRQMEVFSEIVFGDRSASIDRPTLRTVISDRISTENGYSLPPGRVFPQKEPTRGSICRILGEIMGSKNLAIPIPNWHFWDYFKGGKVYLPAWSEEQLVSEFKSAAKSGEIGGLILVSPANPCMYSLSDEAAREIDQVALKEGIEIIVDGVLNGNQPLETRRRTIERKFTRPYVVEGFSKRFGERIGGYLSYILIPEDGKIFPWLEEWGTEAVQKVIGYIVELAFAHQSTLYNELVERNQAFDQGFKRTAPSTIGVERPGPASPISKIILPRRFSQTSDEISKNLLRMEDLLIASSSSFLPWEYDIIAGSEDFLRITVGRHGIDDLYFAGKTIGSYLARASRRSFFNVFR